MGELGHPNRANGIRTRGLTGDSHSNEGYVRPKRPEAAIRWRWVTWKEDDGRRVCHLSPATGSKRSRAACGVGVPFYSTDVDTLNDVDPDRCEKCADREGDLT